MGKGEHKTQQKLMNPTGAEPNLTHEYARIVQVTKAIIRFFSL